MLTIIIVYLFMSGVFAYAHAQAPEEKSDDAMIDYPFISIIFFPGILLGRYLHERMQNAD